MTRPEFRAEMGAFIVRFTSKLDEAVQSVAPYLTERQQKALEYVRAHGSITVLKFQDLFGVKERQAQKDLKA